MSSGDIKLSIVTPVYNRADCVGRCIESVLSQNYPNLEMWIVDDGSTDETTSIITAYQQSNSQIKFHKFEKNRGVNAARNYGIQNSVGDFIIFLDSDDCFVERALDKIYLYLKKHQGYGHYLFMQDDRLGDYARFGLMSQDTIVVQYSDFLLNKVGGDFTHVMKTEILQQYLFSEKLRIYEGLNFYKIFKHNQRLLFCKELVVARERGREDSVTNDYKLINKDAISKKFVMMKSLIEIFQEDYIKYDKSGEVSISLGREAYLLGLASSNYNLDFIAKFLGNWDAKIPSVNQLLCSLRLGFIVRFSIFTYSGIKSLLKK